MKTIFLISTVLSLQSIVVRAQVPISQIEGRLEVYLPSDSTSIHIGKGAGESLDTSLSDQRNTFIGLRSGAGVITGDNNIYIGNDAGRENLTGRDNVYVGHLAGSRSLSSFGTFVGSGAGQDVGNTTYNSCFGYAAGDDVTGNFNTYIGALAGSDASDGTYNTVVGYYAGQSHSGDSNTFLGTFAGEDNRDDSNTFIGASAGRSNGAGNKNSFFGRWAGRYNTNGSDNTFMGSYAAQSNLAGSQSVVIGHEAAINDTKVETSVYIGSRAGVLLQPGEREGNVFIGNLAGHHHEGSNHLFISNTNVDSTEALIYGEFDTGLLRVNGDLHIAANAANGNSRLFMKGIGGDLNEVIRYDGDENDVVMGSVSGGGGKLFLRANSNTHMAIIENGNVGIGTIIPNQKLHVDGSGYFTQNVIIDNELFLNNVVAGAGTSDLRYNASQGRIYTSTSDVRFKRNVNTIENALQKVLALRGVSFNWKDLPNEPAQLGLIAQEVIEVLPEVVSKNSDGYYGVDYTETIGVLIEAIKEQQLMIDDLKEEVVFLKTQLKE